MADIFNSSGSSGVSTGLNTLASLIGDNAWTNTLSSLISSGSSETSSPFDLNSTLNSFNTANPYSPQSTMGSDVMGMLSPSSLLSSLAGQLSQSNTSGWGQSSSMPSWSSSGSSGWGNSPVNGDTLLNSGKLDAIADKPVALQDYMQLAQGLGLSPEEASRGYLKAANDPTISPDGHPTLKGILQSSGQEKPGTVGELLDGLKTGMQSLGQTTGTDAASKAFNAFNTNQDSNVSKRELRKGLKALAGPDGKLDKTKFETFGALLGKSRAQSDNVFNNLSAKGDVTVTGLLQAAKAGNSNRDSWTQDQLSNSLEDLPSNFA